MEKATISQLKNRLSAYLKKVRAGQTILVCDRDQPVARLERVGGDAAGDDRLTRLERAGLVRRAPARPPIPLARLRTGRVRTGRRVAEALIEDRRGGR